MKTLKIAVIGTGDMGKMHVEAWGLAGHKVVSVTDIDHERAQEVADRFKVENTCTDFKQAISVAEVDIVSICLPLPLHAPVTIFAAEQGKHIFCEKPLTRSMEDAIAMEAAVKKAGVQFGIGFQRNMGQDIDILKQAVADNKFGRPLLLNSDRVGSIRKKLAMHDQKGNMGPIMDVGCHTFAYFQKVLQEKPKTVYARGSILSKHAPELASIEEMAIDTGVVTVEYESGNIATMTLSWGLSKGHNYPPMDRMVGPKGGAVIQKSTRLDMKIDGKDEVIEFETENLQQKQFSVFADAINEGRPAPNSFEIAKEVLALTLASFESIQTGQVVHIKDLG